MLHPCADIPLTGIVPGIVEAGTAQVLGKKFLISEVALKVMGITVSLVVSQVFHQFGGGIAQMQGNRGVVATVHQAQSGINGHIGGIALGTCGEVYGTLRQDNPGFGHAYLVDSVVCS